MSTAVVISPAIHASSTMHAPLCHAPSPFPTLPCMPPLPCMPSLPHTPPFATHIPPLPHMPPSPCTPPCHACPLTTDRCLWKHYLSATTVVDGNNRNPKRKLHLTWHEFRHSWNFWNPQNHSLFKWYKPALSCSDLWPKGMVSYVIRMTRLPWHNQCRSYIDNFRATLQTKISLNNFIGFWVIFWQNIRSFRSHFTM